MDGIVCGLSIHTISFAFEQWVHYYHKVSQILCSNFQRTSCTLWKLNKMNSKKMSSFRLILLVLFHLFFFSSRKSLFLWFFFLFVRLFVFQKVHCIQKYAVGTIFSGNCDFVFIFKAVDLVVFHFLFVSFHWKMQIFFLYYSKTPKRYSSIYAKMLVELLCLLGPAMMFVFLHTLSLSLHLYSFVLLSLCARCHI